MSYTPQNYEPEQLKRARYVKSKFGANAATTWIAWTLWACFTLFVIACVIGFIALG